MENNKFTIETIFENLINEETGESYKQVDTQYLTYEGKRVLEGFDMWILSQNDTICYFEDMFTEKIVDMTTGEVLFDHSSFFENPDIELEHTKEEIDIVAKKQERFINYIKKLS